MEPPVQALPRLAEPAHVVDDDHDHVYDDDNGHDDDVDGGDVDCDHDNVGIGTAPAS